MQPRSGRTIQLTAGASLSFIGLLVVFSLGHVHTTNVAAQPSSRVIRLATVRTIVDGGLLPELVTDFEQRSGYRVAVSVGEAVYDEARAGHADIVFSHFGHKQTQAFISAGLGEWPQLVLFNQIALLMPPADPAQIADVTDPVEAFRRIAQTQSAFVVNDSDGLRSLAETLWNAAGRPEKGDWYVDAGVREQGAVQAADAAGGYTFWGLTPFLVAQQHLPLRLRPLILNDVLLQRVMATVVVNPERFPEANVAGARALQQYLLEPATQARIRAYRYPGIDQPIFWPAARNNSPTPLLPSP